MNNNDYISKLGRRIKKLRTEKGLTYTDVSVKCGIDEGNIRRLERGDTNPTITTLLKIADGIGVKLSELIDIE